LENGLNPKGNYEVDLPAMFDSLRKVYINAGTGADGRARMKIFWESHNTSSVTRVFLHNGEDRKKELLPPPALKPLDPEGLDFWMKKSTEL
jgi:hypothetical protein